MEKSVTFDNYLERPQALFGPVDPRRVQQWRTNACFRYPPAVKLSGGGAMASQARLLQRSLADCSDGRPYYYIQ